MSQIVIKADQHHGSMTTLVEQWPARARALRRMLAYTIARDVFKDVRGRIPPAHSALRKSLRLSRVIGLPDRASGYVVHSVPRGGSVAAAEEPSTVLYVTAKTNLMTGVPQSVKILEEHSPWTVDTLPFQPDLKFAIVISRKASPRTVVKVRKMRRRDRYKWRRKMQEIGLREVNKGTRLTANRKMKSIPDVAFESVRLEFGLGGGQSRPHWRPAIIKLAARGVTGMIAANPQFSKAMTDPSYSGWRSWPPPTSTRATLVEALAYVPFQKKLGIRGRK